LPFASQNWLAVHPGDGRRIQVSNSPTDAAGIGKLQADAELIDRAELVERYGEHIADWVLGKSCLTGDCKQAVIEVDHAELLVAEHGATCCNRGCCDE
jgi:hypothetical protein